MGLGDISHGTAAWAPVRIYVKRLHVEGHDLQNGMVCDPFARAQGLASNFEGETGDHDFSTFPLLQILYDTIS